MSAHVLPSQSEPGARGGSGLLARVGWWPGARIADSHGCRRGWGRNLWALGRTRWSAARHFAAIDWSAVRRLVFVCQGNICRSPYAEGRASLAGIGIPAASCGLRVREDAAHPRAIDLARLRGVDLSRHRPRAIGAFSWRSGDLAVAMELPQAKVIFDGMPALGSTVLQTQMSQFHMTLPQTTLLGLWSSPRRPHLQDPYGLSDAYFERCFGIIDDAIERMGACWAKGRRE